MSASQLTSRKFNEELEAVRSQVLKMGGIVEEQLTLALRALVGCDADLAQEVVLGDRRVNALEVAIDEECTRIVATLHPAEQDLRLVMSVIKTISDLERIGDEAKRIARMVVRELSGSLNNEVRQELEYMGDLVRTMLRRVLDALARTDVDTAMRVVDEGARVDLKYGTISRLLVTYMVEDPRSIPLMLNLLWAARALERMGDRCENIAEYIFYLVHGRDIRHPHSRQAMAEAEETPTRAGEDIAVRGGQ